MAKGFAIQRIAGLLNFWEKQCVSWKIKHFQKHLPPQPAFDKFLNFRSFLLTATDEMIRIGMHFRFTPFTQKQIETFDPQAMVPFSVLAWNSQSRRIYSLSRDLQTLLEATSLKNIRWKDVFFPFNSFVIELDEPLKSSVGTEFDCIMFSRLDELLHINNGKQLWEIRLLCKEIGTCRQIKKRDAQKLFEFCQKEEKYGEEIKKMRKRYFSDIHVKMPVVYGMTDPASDQPVVEILATLKNIRKGVSEYAMDAAFHILVNFCIYVQNFPKSTSSFRFTPQQNGKKKKKRKKRKKTPLFINQMTEIFTVTCEFKETGKELAAIKRDKAHTGPGKCVHWRKAHWRRKPGYGDVPFESAPKIRIPAVLVNAHKLPENALPVAGRANL